MQKSIEELEQENARLVSILCSLFPDKSGSYFICGSNGNVDGMGLPERLFICPTYGLDGFAVYQKVSEYTAPGW